MSLYVEWVNRIKAAADDSWLTDHQRGAYERILEGWQAHRFVCLCGPPGCGKTFIAWILAKEHHYAHVARLAQAPDGTANVVVDGEPYSRPMRVEAETRGIGRVIMALRQPPAEAMPCAHLQLTERDVLQFQRNLTRHHVLTAFHCDAVGTDLGQILRAEAIERGKSYVGR